jgi:Ni/Co efflux regulator RcnB
MASASAVEAHGERDYGRPEVRRAAPRAQPAYAAPSRQQGGGYYAPGYAAPRAPAYPAGRQAYPQGYPQSYPNYSGARVPAYGGQGYAQPYGGQRYAPVAGYGRWRRGQILPPAYRGGVIYDYGRYHLRRPPRGYYWVQEGDDFVLVAIATGLIFEVIPGGY